LVGKKTDGLSARRPERKFSTFGAWQRLCRGAIERTHEQHMLSFGQTNKDKIVAIRRDGRCSALVSEGEHVYVWRGLNDRPYDARGAGRSGKNVSRDGTDGHEQKRGGRIQENLFEAGSGACGSLPSRGLGRRLRDPEQLTLDVARVLPTFFRVF